MIVGASWVAFWINRNDAAGRVAVGKYWVNTFAIHAKNVIDRYFVKSEYIIWNFITVV